MTRRRQLLQAGALGTAATFTTSLYAQTRPTVRWRMAALYPPQPGHLLRRDRTDVQARGRADRR